MLSPTHIHHNTIQTQTLMFIADPVYISFSKSTKAFLLYFWHCAFLCIVITPSIHFLQLWKRETEERGVTIRLIRMAKGKNMYLSEGHEASACDENTFFVWLKVCSFCLAVHTQWAIVGGLCEDINAVIVRMGWGGGVCRLRE